METSQDDEVAELRKLLVGVKWSDFRFGREVQCGDVTLNGRWGVFLHKMCIVVVAKGKFVAIRFIRQYTGIISPPDLLLDPKNIRGCGEELSSGLDLSIIRNAPYVLDPAGDEHDEG